MPRFQPTYANVVSTLALFVALGGVGYAAATLPSNSVGTKQLRKNAVRNSDIKRGAVGTAKVKNGSLREADFKSGELPKGDKGDQGPPGGPPPVEAWRVVDASGQPPFLTTWDNNDPTNFNTAAFFRDVSGVVHLRGLVSGGTTADIFQLPAGYFPPKTHSYVASTTAGAAAEVLISPTGVISRGSFIAPSGPLSLEGISFRATG